MITKSELIEYLKHTPENTNYNILRSALYNGSNKEAVDEFIEVLSHGNLSLAALQPYLAKLYEDDKTISPEPLPPLFIGGSPDAVLYTAQTLTDAQKKQARENIDAASEFVVNASAMNGSEVTVDKTYAQISEAIKAGKTPSVYLLHRSVGPVYLRLFSYYENQPITFSGNGEGEKYPYMLSLVMEEDGSTNIVVDRLVEIAEDGTMRQVRMDGDPYSAMEIATKQYVDDHATGGIDMGITGATVGQIAKITAVDASGVPTAWSPADMTSGGSPDAVLYTAQALSYAQKKQARENIEAAGSVWPTITGPVALCPDNITDSVNAVQVTTTKDSDTDFTVTLGGLAGRTYVRVDGIRTPTYDDIFSAANVEFVLHAAYITVENSQVTDYDFSEINEEYERGTFNIWLETEGTEIRLASGNLLSNGALKLIFIGSSDGAGIEVHSVTVSESTAEYAVTSMANGNEVSY